MQNRRAPSRATTADENLYISKGISGPDLDRPTKPSKAVRALIRSWPSTFIHRLVHKRVAKPPPDCTINTQLLTLPMAGQRGEPVLQYRSVSFYPLPPSFNRNGCAKANTSAGSLYSRNLEQKVLRPPERPRSAQRRARLPMQRTAPSAALLRRREACWSPLRLAAALGDRARPKPTTGSLRLGLVLDRQCR